jgi:hypothetical protein
MSSIPPATTDPNPPAGEPGTPFAPATPGETAPSAILAEVPALTRVLGVVGLFLTILGSVVVAFTRGTGTARMLPESWGYIFAGVGLVSLLYHCVTDNDREIRRIYGLVSVFLLLVGLFAGIIPGPYDEAGTAKQFGYYFLPWGLGCAVLGLLFMVPFARHETDELLRNLAGTIMFGLGGGLCIVVPIVGLINPDFLVGSGLPLALLGVAFVCGFMGLVDTSEGLGYYAALGIGVLGGAILFCTFALSVFPTVLFDGPAVLRKSNQLLDRTAVAMRVLTILAFLGVAALGAVRQGALWLRAALVAVGLVSAGVFIAGSLNTQLSLPPRIFLVPGGLILAFIGFVYLAVGLSVCSDNQFVALTRREMSAYFISPLGYLVLGGMAACQWLGYYLFYRRLEQHGRAQVPMQEPIVGEYLMALIPILCVILPIPALTMRLFAEEKRTGSLEVLLTAPVNEWPVVLSKFFATWVFFLICWLPAGLFLLAVRVEAGVGFDYRPLLSFYAALAACSAAFVATGVFCSTLSSNQIVGAFVTFVLMLGLVVCFFIKRQEDLGLPALLQALLVRLSFIDMWQQSLDGQLAVRDLLVWLSVAVFNLFLSVKVLEARKWN